MPETNWFIRNGVESALFQHILLLVSTYNSLRAGCILSIASDEFKFVGVAQLEQNPGPAVDKNLYHLAPGRARQGANDCGSLQEALDSLAADHDFC